MADHENAELLQQWYSCTVPLASVSLLKTFMSSKNHRRKKPSLVRKPKSLANLY